MTSILGSVRRLADGRGAVRVEDLYDTDIADLWAALTDPDRLSNWIADVKGELRLGGALYARFTSSWEGPGRVDTCDAPHHLAVTMTPGTPEETVIEATLTPEGAKTRLVIEERGIPVAELAAHGAGWQAHVEDLAAYVHSGRSSEWRARWAALIPAYEPLGAGLAGQAVDGDVRA